MNSTSNADIIRETWASWKNQDFDLSEAMAEHFEEILKRDPAAAAILIELFEQEDDEFDKELLASFITDSHPVHPPVRSFLKETMGWTDDEIDGLD